MAHIEAYFENELSETQKREFEEAILSDPELAATVAFYLHAKQAASQALSAERERFKAIYLMQKEVNDGLPKPVSVVRKMWPWLAAAVVLAGIILGAQLLLRPSLPTMADGYFHSHFEQLPVTMGSRHDSLQKALGLYNDGNPKQSLAHLERLVETDSTFYDAIKYAGIVSLQLGDYDKATNYFSLLEKASLYANPGKFYHALALMKRNRPGDKQAARILLEQVVQNDLEEKETAQQFLRKW